MLSNFDFLDEIAPDLASLAKKAERLLHVDPASTLGKLRLLIDRLYAKLVPNVEGVHLHLLGQAGVDKRVQDLMVKIRNAGHKGVHEDAGTAQEALQHLVACRSVLIWYYRRVTKNPDFGQPKFVIPPKVEEFAAAALAKRISERTKAQMNLKREAGQRFGRPRFEDSDTIARVCELRHEGGSLRQIAAILESEGRPTANGGPWHAEMIRRLILRHTDSSESA